MIDQPNGVTLRRTDSGQTFLSVLGHPAQRIDGSAAFMVVGLQKQGRLTVDLALKIMRSEAVRHGEA